MSQFRDGAPDRCREKVQTILNFLGNFKSSNSEIVGRQQEFNSVHQVTMEFFFFVRRKAVLPEFDQGAGHFKLFVKDGPASCFCGVCGQSGFDLQQAECVLDL